MPIEIIPKRKKVTPPWQIIVFCISVILLLLLIFSYFFLSNQEKKYQGKLEEIKTEIEKETQKEEEKIKEISEINERISAFTKIIQGHFFVSKLFENLAKFTHPKVFYTAFELIPEKNSLSLSGQTENFLVLGQQIILLKENPMVSEVELSKVSKTKEGKVEFDFNLIFNSQAFKW